MQNSQDKILRYLSDPLCDEFRQEDTKNVNQVTYGVIYDDK